MMLNVFNLSDSKEMWNKLKYICEIGNTTSKFVLKEDLYFLELYEGKSVRQYLEDVNLLVTKLARIGIMVVDEDLVGQTLSSLPRSWTTFLRIQCLRNPMLRFHNLKVLLLQEET